MKELESINKSLDNIEKSMDDCIVMLTEMKERIEGREEKGFWKSIHLEKLFFKDGGSNNSRT